MHLEAGATDNTAAPELPIADAELDYEDRGTVDVSVSRHNHDDLSRLGSNPSGWSSRPLFGFNDQSRFARSPPDEPLDRVRPHTETTTL